MKKLSLDDFRKLRRLVYRGARPLEFFIVVIIFVGLYIGTLCTKKCTWSLSAPISKNFISYRFSISWHVSFKVAYGFIGKYVE